MTRSTGQRVRRGTRSAWAQAQAGKHLCECGCGQFVRITPEHYPNPPSFLHGHNQTRVRADKAQQACECGCGELASPGKRYRPYHARRPLIAARHFAPPTPCACGCGGEAQGLAEYIHGHNSFRPLEERFWEKVDKTDTCWLWTGTQNSKGYGHTSINRTHVGAHRVAWELTRGPIPKGLEIDHLCSVRNCVRPDHLEPVTHAENVRRAWTKPKH